MNQNRRKYAQKKQQQKKKLVKPVESFFYLSGKNGNTHIWPQILCAAMENKYHFLILFTYEYIRTFNTHWSGKNAFALTESQSDGREKINNPTTTEESEQAFGTLPGEHTCADQVLKHGWRPVVEELNEEHSASGTGRVEAREMKEVRIHRTWPTAMDREEK